MLVQLVMAAITTEPVPMLAFFFAAVSTLTDLPKDLARFAESVFGDGPLNGVEKFAAQIAKPDAVLRTFRPGHAGFHVGEIEFEICE